MKRKIVKIIVGIIVILSIGFNIYQVNKSHTIASERDTALTEKEGYQQKYESLQTDYDAVVETNSSLQSDLEEKNAEIETLKKENSSLKSQVESLKKN